MLPWLSLIVLACYAALAGAAPKEATIVDEDGTTTTLVRPPVTPPPPVDPPPVEPPPVTPPPVEPPPVTPPPAGGPYPEIGGVDPNAMPVGDGADVSSLDGSFRFTRDGTWTASNGLKTGVKLYAPDGADVKIQLKTQTTAKDATLAGVTFVGFANAKDDNNENACIRLDGRTRTHSVGYTGSAGVMSCVVGDNVTQWYPHVYDCGTIGRGWLKVGGYVEMFGKIERVGLAKLTNSANKGTRAKAYGEVKDPAGNPMHGVYVYGTEYRDNFGGDQWLDNYNKSAWFERCYFANTKTDKSGEWFKGTAFRTELGRGVVTIKDCRFENVAGAAIAANESPNVKIDGVTFGKCKYTIELRNMLRKDDSTGTWDGSTANEDTFASRTFNLVVRNCVGLPGAGPAALSSTKVKGGELTRDDDQIVVEPSNTGIDFSAWK
jgi:hypothetical protein